MNSIAGAVRRPAPLPSPIGVSVVVPARDEEETLPALLDALLAQTHPPDEIIVADGGSTDRTLEVAERYGAQGVRAHAIGPALPGGGRNAAIRRASHPWVALIDAGCRPDPCWLAELLTPLSGDAELDVVFGDHLPVIEREWDRIQALTIMAPRNPQTGVHGPSTASMLLRRSLWERIGGFREDLRAAEDHLFFSALSAAPARTAWAPRAIVHWRLSAGPAATWRRLVSYSQHHLRAGLFSTWHRRVMLMDLVAAATFLILPPWPALSLVLSLLGARAFATAWRRRGNLAEPCPLRASRLLGVASLLLLADVAVWLGAVKLIARRLLRT